MAKKRLRLILICVPLVALAFGANWVYRVSSSFTDSKTNIIQVWQGMTNPMSQFPNTTKMTLLLVGQDYNHNSKGYQFSKNSRADTIMLMSVDLQTKKLSAISIPRDTRIRAADGKVGKINATYSRGGIELLKQTLEEKFGITIDYYVAIRPDAVPKIVDAVGGIDVETIDEMNYDDSWANLHIHLPEGKQHIDGQQAVGFVRFREVNRYRMNENGRMVPLRGVKSSKEEGDLRRVARQQQFMRALISEANKPGNIIHADSIINTGFSQIDTSLTRLQILALATIFKGSSGEAMSGATLPGTDDTSGDAYYYVLDEDRSQATVDWLLKGDEAAAKSLVRISIKNSTQVKGAAKAAADLLAAEGYSASNDGNDTVEHPITEVIFYRAANEPQAQAIKALLGLATVRKEPVSAAYTGPEITIVIGVDSAQAIVDKKSLASTTTP